jgi:hypothetical protein
VPRALANMSRTVKRRVGPCRCRQRLSGVRRPCGARRHPAVSCGPGFSTPRTQHTAMPLAFARFPLAIHPSGILAKDGQLYATVTGSATAIVTMSPTIVVDLKLVGGHGIGVRWAAILWILGRTFTFAVSVDSLSLAPYIVSVTKLGEFLDELCSAARNLSLLAERRPSQLRGFFRRVAVEAGLEGTFVVEQVDLIAIATLLPAEAPAAAPAPAASPPSGGSGILIAGVVIARAGARVLLVQYTAPYSLPLLYVCGTSKGARD